MPMNFSSNGTLLVKEKKVDREVVGSKIIRCMCNLPILKSGFIISFVCTG
jgi:hypothetical protein